MDLVTSQFTSQLPTTIKVSDPKSIIKPVAPTITPTQATVNSILSQGLDIFKNLTTKAQNVLPFTPGIIPGSSGSPGSNTATVYNPNLQPPQPPPPAATPGLSTGAKVGIGVGLLAVTGVIIAAVANKKKKKQKK